MKIDNYIINYMKCGMKTASAAFCKGNIIYFFERAIEQKNNIDETKEYVEKFKEIQQKIDEFDEKCFKNMSFFGFFGSFAQNNAAKKKDFFNKICMIIDNTDCSSAVMYAAYMYAATAKTTMYSGCGSENIGRTCRALVECANWHDPNNPSVIAAIQEGLKYTNLWTGDKGIVNMILSEARFS